MNPHPDTALDVDVPTACCEVLEPRLADWLDDVDDSLFRLVETTRDANEPARLLDGLRAVRRERAAIVERFLDSLDMACYRYAAGQPCVDWHDSAELLPVHPEEPQAELGYALASLQSRGERQHDHALSKLYQRLSEIRGDGEIDHWGSPVSPASLCGAARSSLKDVAVDDRSLAVIAKLFERHFVAPLDEICEDLLVSLYRTPAELVIPDEDDEEGLEEVIGRGVRAASQLFTQVRGLVLRRNVEAEREDRAAEAAAAPNPSAADEPATSSEPPEPAEVDIPLPPDLATSTDEDPVAAAEPEPEEAPREPTTPSSGIDPIVTAGQLDDALTVLQARMLGEELDGESLKGAEALRNEMHAQIERLWTGETRPRLSPDHETAIELAELVFEFIRQDDAMRPSLRAALARLQVPYMRVALMAPELFAQTEHPARQLLDALAETALAFGDQDGVRDKLHEVVHRVLEDFESDCALFEQFLGSFGRYAAQLKRTAQVSERKAAQIEEGRERIRVARKQATTAISDRVRDADLPDAVHELLRHPWVNVMTLTWLRHGGDSTEWRQALQFVDDLIWGLEPKQSAADVARLQSLMPTVSRHLGRGLEEVALGTEDVREVFAQLRNLYRERLDERYRDVLHLPDSFGRRKPFLTRSVAPRSTPGARATAAAQALPDNHQVWVEAVRGLQAGAWFDMKVEDGTTVRAKLSWINPINQTLLFVDDNGLKLANKGVSEFATELQTGESTMLENVPLFERAMAAISQRLRQDRQEAS